MRMKKKTELARRPEVQTPFLAFLFLFVVDRVACMHILLEGFSFLLMSLVDLLYKDYQTDHKFTQTTFSPAAAVSGFHFFLFFMSIPSFRSFYLVFGLILLFLVVFFFSLKFFRGPFLYNAHIVLMF